VSDAPTISDRLAREFAEGLADLERAGTIAAIPTPSEDAPSISRSVRAIKQAIDQLAGSSGSVLDKALTIRDLLRINALAYSPSVGLYAAAPTYVSVGGGGSGGPGGGGG
jgi:hypothetical protein